MIRSLYKREIAVSGIDQVQILSPYRSKGEASADVLNERIREEVNPPMDGKPEVTFGGKTFRLNDRVMQTKNNSFVQFRDRDGNKLTPGVFNGEIGRVCDIEPGKITVNFDDRFADYPLEGLNDLVLSYASTVHKAQGSEYDTVIIPLLMSHRILLTRNLLNTAITRAKRRVLLVGQIKALYTAIHTNRKGKRKTLLAERMRLYYQSQTHKTPVAANTRMKQAS